MTIDEQRLEVQKLIDNPAMRKNLEYLLFDVKANIPTVFDCCDTQIHNGQIFADAFDIKKIDCESIFNALTWGPTTSDIQTAIQNFLMVLINLACINKFAEKWNDKYSQFLQAKGCSALTPSDVILDLYSYQSSRPDILLYFLIRNKFEDNTKIISDFKNHRVQMWMRTTQNAEEQFRLRDSFEKILGTKKVVDLKTDDIKFQIEYEIKKHIMI